MKTINQLLHRNSSSPIPNSLPSCSIAKSFCSFFSGKITTLCLSLISKTTIDSPPSPSTTHDSPPSPPEATLNTFLHLRLKYFICYNLSLTNSANLTLYITERLRVYPCSHQKKIINLSLSTGSFPPTLQTVISHSTPKETIAQ